MAHVYLIDGPSMVPTLCEGDLVIAVPIKFVFLEVEVREVLTYINQVSCLVLGASWPVRALTRQGGLFKHRSR